MCLGIPGQIVEITDVNRQMALVDVSGVQREVSLECVVDDYFPLEKCVGHWALIHVGFAMSLINEGEAEATLKVLRELGEVQAEILTTFNVRHILPVREPGNPQNEELRRLAPNLKLLHPKEFAQEIVGRL